MSQDPTSRGIYRRPRFTSTADIPVCAEQARADLSKLADLVPRTANADDLVQVLVRVLPIIIGVKEALNGAAAWIEQHDLELWIRHPHADESIEDQPEAILWAVELIRGLEADLAEVLKTHVDFGALMLSLQDTPPAAS
jgi:hypothetical protein